LAAAAASAFQLAVVAMYGFTWRLNKRREEAKGTILHMKLLCLVTRLPCMPVMTSPVLQAALL